MSAMKILDSSDVLRRTAQSVGISLQQEGTPHASGALIAQLLRRAVFNTAPCAARALRSQVLGALSPLVPDIDVLKAAIEDALQNLIAVGDILEMQADNSDQSGAVLRPAPPAFVLRRDGAFIILGISGDEITPVSASLVQHHESGLRTMRPADTMACRTELLGLGLIELSERVWSHAPPAATADDFVTQWIAKLPIERRPEIIEGLEIIDPSLPKSFYKGRWTNLRPSHDGTFVARRPQRYGAKLWCLAEVKGGAVHRFIDIHARDSRARDCDEAWRLLAALDHVAGTPQTVGVVEHGAAVILGFSAPLPAWAVRRLGAIGEQITMPRRLLGFKIPVESAQDELRWLTENIWIVREDRAEVV